VAPVYGIGEPSDGVIHLAGGFVEFREDHAGRHFRETHRFCGKRLADIRPRLQREVIDFAEFHCMLVRRSAFDRVGELDERLLTTREHLDFCLAVREAGGRVYLEPAALVTYIAPPPFAWSDLPYFLLRWSDEWNHATLEYVRKKWGLAEDDPSRVTDETWLRNHRWTALARPARAIRWILGWRLGTWLIDRSLIPAEGLLTRWLVRRAARERERVHSVFA
jgi:GT2 family glycosyltransferase